MRETRRPIKCVKDYLDVAKPLTYQKDPFNPKNRPSADRHPSKKTDGGIQKLDRMDSGTDQKTRQSDSCQMAEWKC
jgi:hypothetical protein